MFTAFTSTENEKVKKGMRRKKDCSLQKKEKPVRRSKAIAELDLKRQTYKEPCDLSEYG